MNVLNKFLGIFILTINLGYAQDPVPKMDEFGKIYEKFYGDISSGNIESIRPLIISIIGNHQSVYGEALLRNPAGPFGISKITQIANPINFNQSFKRLTGYDVVLYQFLAIKYKYPSDIEKKLISNGVSLESKWLELEEVFCDLWIFGSDGKWRVACDYSPQAALDCQTLGLMFMETSERAAKEQTRIAKEVIDKYDSITGSKQ